MTDDGGDEKSQNRKRTRVDTKDEEPNQPEAKRICISEDSVANKTSRRTFNFASVDPNIWVAIFRFLSLHDACEFSSLSKVWRFVVYESPMFWKDREIAIDDENCLRVIIHDPALCNVRNVRINTTTRQKLGVDMMVAAAKIVDPIVIFPHLTKLTTVGFIDERGMECLAARSATLCTLHIDNFVRFEPNAYNRFNFTPGLSALTQLRDLKITALNGQEICDIAKCTRLTSLDLVALYNSTEADVGNVLIPNCTNLERLSVRATAFVPSELFRLKSLKSLDVHVNPMPNLVEILVEAAKCSELENFEFVLENNDDEDGDDLTERHERLPDDLHFGSNLRTICLNTNMTTKIDRDGMVQIEIVDDLLFRAVTQCPNLQDLVVLTTVGRVTDAGIEACWNARPVACERSLLRLGIESEIKSSTSIRRIAETFPRVSLFELFDCDDELGECDPSAMDQLCIAHHLVYFKWPDVAMPKLRDFAHFLMTRKSTDLKDIMIIGTGRSIPMTANEENLYRTMATAVGVNLERDSPPLLPSVHAASSIVE